MSNVIDDITNFSKPKFAIKSTIGHYWRKFWGWTPMYWLRCHTFTRYHIIDLRGRDGYTWGWLDRDHAMFIACFKLLEEYVEKEKPHDVIEWSEDIDTWNAIFELYWWWKFGRKMENDACAEFFDAHKVEGIPFPEPEPGALTVPLNEWLDSKWDDLRNQEIWLDWYRALEEKDQAQLERLIKIRRTLWT